MKSLERFQQQPFLRWQHLAIVAVISAVGFLFIWIAFDSWNRHSRLEASGINAEAVVTSKQTGNTFRGDIWYEVDYTFSANGTLQSGTSRAEPADWQKVATGGRLAIRFLEGNPAVNRALIAKTPLPDALASLVLGLICLAAAGWVFIARPRIRI
ncbi:MAG: hypothetical protein ACOVKS_10185 [Aquimonas sp.]|jgi:hypothetical protein